MLSKLRRCLLVLLLASVVACNWFTDPGYTTESGEKVPEQIGVVDQAAKTAAAAAATGVPFAGIAAAVLGILGAAGTYFEHRKGKKRDEVTVHLVDAFKNRAEDLKSDKDVEDIVESIAKKNPKWGKYLLKAWQRVRQIK